MPSPLRSPKALPAWFELDYFRRGRLLRRLWRPVLWGALAATALGVACTFLPGMQTAYEAGPLSNAHALFNHDCGKCHAQAFGAIRRFWDADARSVPDAACAACHAGPPHHETADQSGCAGCHREHHGQAVLARVTDSQCTTSCHANLTRITKDSRYNPHITGFGAGEHPEFKARKDPGTIKFNHAVHLQGLRGIDSKQFWKQLEFVRKNSGAHARLPEPGQQTRQLGCQFCHQTDSAGRYMQPIRYEQHCKECHPLSVQLVGNDKGLQGLAAEFSKTPAPHPVHGDEQSPGKTAQTVRAALRERLTDFILDDRHKGFLGESPDASPERAVPGWPRPPAVSKAQFDWVNRQLAQTERILFESAGGCGYCHQEKTAPDKRPGGLPEYEPSGIKPRWHEQSAFRHDSHRMLRCAECHAAAESSQKTRDVLLPQIDTCRRCHNPQAGARADCAECHSYHNAEPKRAFRGRLSITDSIGR
jgi:hypothetical protein